MNKDQRETSWLLSRLDNFFFGYFPQKIERDSKVDVKFHVFVDLSKLVSSFRGNFQNKILTFRLDSVRFERVSYLYR